MNGIGLVKKINFNNFSTISENVFLNSKSWDFLGYYTIVVTKSHKDQAIFDAILQDFWNNDIINVNILAHNPKRTGKHLVLLTYFPFTTFHCGDVVPVVWNHFSENRFVVSDRELFPPKTENFYQCPVSVLAAPMRPFFFMDDKNTVGGIESDLIKLLSVRLNFKSSLLVHQHLEIGIIHKNGTITEALGQVSE